MFAHFEFISLYGMASAFFVLCGRDFFKKKHKKNQKYVSCGGWLASWRKRIWSISPFKSQFQVYFLLLVMETSIYGCSPTAEDKCLVSECQQGRVLVMQRLNKHDK